MHIGSLSGGLLHRYPSAIASMKSSSSRIPLLAIGSELGADCAPVESNYQKFYEAAKGPAVEIVIQDSGHFQFLDHPTTLERAICLQGRTEDAEVRKITQSFVVAWGEATLKRRHNALEYRPFGTTGRDLSTSRTRSRTKKQQNEVMKTVLPQQRLAALLQSTTHISERRKKFSTFASTCEEQER